MGSEMCIRDSWQTNYTTKERHFGPKTINIGIGKASDTANRRPSNILGHGGPDPENYMVVPPKVPQPRGRGATGGLPFAIWLLADQLYHRRTSLWPIGYRHWHLQSQRHRKQAAQQYIRARRRTGPDRQLHGSAPKGTQTARPGSYRWFAIRHMAIGRPLIPPRNVTLAHRLSTLASAKPATPG